MHKRKTAKHKLNTAHVHGALVIAGFLGLVTGSWTIFLLATGVIVATSVQDGSIRLYELGGAIIESRCHCGDGGLFFSYWGNDFADRSADLLNWSVRRRSCNAVRSRSSCCIY